MSVETDNIYELSDLEKINFFINKYKEVDIEYHEYHSHHVLLHFKKLFYSLKYEEVITLFKKEFNQEKIHSIIYNECFKLLVSFRKQIDNLIKISTENIPESFLNLGKNDFVYKIDTNIQKNETFYFGIVIPVYKRYYTTKIFFECLKKNVNFKSIVFCIVDDGSDDGAINILKNLNELKFIIIYCNRGKNFYSSHNTQIPGSMYPMTLYIGHEFLKKRCSILGVLDSDSFITPEYFKTAYDFCKHLNMDDTIFSGFNSYSECHQIYKTTKINNVGVHFKNMVGGISQFYSTSLYERFKFKFTGEESIYFFAYDYDFQISNFMNERKKKYVCLDKSTVQHIGIKSCMIRNNMFIKNDDKELINLVYKLLLFPKKKKDLKFDFDFDIKLKFKKSNINKIFKNLLVDNFIDKIYYINLDERVDRKINMEEQFRKLGITNYERISAVKPVFNPKYNNKYVDTQINNYINNKKNFTCKYGIVNDLIKDINIKYILDFSKLYIKSKSKENRRKYILGALGCKMSHLKILKLSFERNYENILVLEDDSLFHEDFNNYFHKLIFNLKNIDFDMIWLAPNWLFKDNNGILNRCYSYKYVNEHLAFVNPSKSIDGNYGSTSSTGGQIFSNKSIKYILNIFEKSKQKEIDLWYREYIQQRGKVYSPVPNLIRQRVGESNIEDVIVNYDKDLNYKTRFKFNIFTIVNEENKDEYIKNLSHNLMKMIGYENIYYLSDKELFDNEILHFFDIKKLEGDIKLNFVKNVNHNIQHYYYMDIETRFENNFLPFDENNNLILPENFYCKN